LLAVNRGVDVTVGDDNILPPVAVEVHEGRAPAEKRNRRLAESRLESYVGEVAFAIVVVERVRVVGEVRDVEVYEAVVVVVTDGDAHARLLAPVLVKGHARRVADLLEGSVALVEIELLRSGVVDDDEVEQVVFVDVHEGGGEAVVTLLVARARLVGNILERAVRFLV